jgi:NitT/TauT family transport system permease protein
MKTKTKGPEDTLTTAADPTVAAVAPAPMGSMIRMKSLALSMLIPLVIPALLIAVWQYAGERKLIADGLFPSFTASVMALGDFIFGIAERSAPYSGEWVEALVASSGRILSGYALGAAIGVVLGLIAGYAPLARLAVNPMIDALRPISITAWIPIALILFGIGDRPAIFLTALATFFPVYVNTVIGAQSSEGRLLRAAAMLGANKRQMLLKVTLPATMPSIATGMRVGLALAWTTVVVAEILGARSGLGYVLIDAYNQFRFDYVVACMISLGALGFLSDRLLAFAFKRPLRWVEHAARA